METNNNIGDDLKLDKNEVEKEEAKKKKLKEFNYWKIWGGKRTAGAVYHIWNIGFLLLLAYIYIKICYLVVKRTFAFSFDLIAIPICFGVGILYWYFHEIIYKKKFPEKTSNRTKANKRRRSRKKRSRK